MMPGTDDLTGRRRAAGLAAVALAAVTGAAPALDLQGHRGARGLAPENTLPAFALALSLGVTTLEMDAGVTRDHVVVVSHDPRLDPDITRTPGGGWLAAEGPPLRGLTARALARYDVGRIRPASAYARRFPDQRPVDGARIPALADVIALAARAGNTEVRFSVETKIDPRSPHLTLAPGPFADALVQVLRDGGVSERAAIQSFDWRTLARVRERAPAIERVHLTAEQGWLDNVQRGRPGASPWTAGGDVDDHGGSVPRLVQAAGGHVWSPYAGDVDAAAVAEAHDLGLRVVVWTVNGPAAMHALIDLGVDGIITDYPDRLRAVMAERGMALPEATPVAP